jgi:hypothetical protein
MHDAFTREFVNVGVLVYVARSRFLSFEKLSSLDRVKSMFPGLQSDSLRALLAFLGSRVNELQSKISEQLDSEFLSAEAIAAILLPTDDSALQWSAPGGGATADPKETLKELFDRLVAMHLKAHPPVRREDSDVWKPFERELRQRNVLSRLQEKTLKEGELQHNFKNAWQPIGGYLRLYQPLSLDLVEPSDIVEKAIRWSGLLRQLRKGTPDFRIFLLLGKPFDNRRLKAFDQACEALAEDKEWKELVLEEDAPKFAAEVEKDINAVSRN